MVRTIITSVVLGGRRIQPAAFSITLAAVALFLTYVGRERVDGPWENILAALALVTALTMTAGWIVNSHAAMRAGLLLSVAMWTFTAWIAAVGLGALTSFLLAIAWTVLAGGSYWLEEVEAQAAKRRGSA